MSAAAARCAAPRAIRSGAQDRDFIDAVRGGENRIRAPYAEALQTHLVALAVAQSARTGAPVRMEGLRADPQPIVSPCRCRRAPMSPERRAHRPLARHRARRARPFFADYREGPAGRGPGAARAALHRPFGRHRADLPQGHQPLSARPLGRRRAASSCRASPGRAIRCRSSATWKSAEVIDAPRARLRAPATSSPRPSATRPATPPIPRTTCWSRCPPTSIRSSASSSPRWARSAPTASCMPMPRRSAPPAPRLGAGIAGRPVVVWGGGMVGLLTALFARRAGRRGGGRRALRLAPRPSPHASASRPCPRTTPGPMPSAAGTAHGGRGADIVFQTRAHADSLHRALRALRPQGTVIDLAFYQGGLDATAARRGVPPQRPRDPLRPDQPGAARLRAALGPPPPRAGDRARCSRAEGAAIRRHLITHVVPFDEAPTSCAACCATGRTSCRSSSRPR